MTIVRCDCCGGPVMPTGNGDRFYPECDFWEPTPTLTEDRPMDAKTYNAIQAKLESAAALLVEAALLQLRAEEPGESPAYYADRLQEGQAMIDTEFESDF